MNGRGLRLIAGSAAAGASPLDADAFQAACVEAFVASWSARGFSPVTIANNTGVLEASWSCCAFQRGRRAWTTSTASSVSS